MVFTSSSLLYDKSVLKERKTKMTKDIKYFNKNEVIFKEGEMANCMYDIHFGRVGIFAAYGTENEKMLTELKL